MSAIGPGDWLESLVDGFGLVRGAVYRCREVAPAPDWVAECMECGNHTDVVRLDGVSAPDGWEYCICELRPIYRPKPDAFAHLLKEPTHA